MKARNLLTGLALLGFAVCARAAPPQGLIDSSKQMIDYLQEIESKLVADQPALNTGFENFMDGAGTLVDNLSDGRKEMERQQILLDLQSVWDDSRFRKPVLYRIAQVNLAVDDIAIAQLDAIRGLEIKRRAAYRELIAQVKSLRRNQAALLEYLADDSASKQLGELNVGLLATSVAEAKTLRNKLNGVVDEEIDVDEEREALQRAVDNLQRLLDRIER